MLDKIDRQYASVSGMIYVKIREAILDGRLTPGESLVEERLAEDLDVSRTPLREALAKLEHEGLIQSVPYRGTVVVTTTLSKVMQTMQIRERLELLAIELAIHVMPAEEIERVAALITERLPLLLEGDLQAHFECNQEFHGLAPRFSGNPILEQMICSLVEKAHTYRLRKLNDESTLAEIVASTDEHLNVLEMYRRRDMHGAIEEMDHHLHITHQRLDRPVPSRSARSNGAGTD